MATGCDDGDYNTIVIDYGSNLCNSGFAGDDAPRSRIKTVVGKPKYEIVGLFDKENYVGEESQRKRELLQMSYPVERGVVTDWDAMEKIWHHAITQDLHANPEENAVLVADPPLNPKRNREKMIEVILEGLHCESFFVTIQAMCASIASGRGTAITMVSGDGVTQIVPIYEGHILNTAIKRINFAGSDITEYLASSLNARGNSFSEPADLHIIRTIKEKLCYVSLDPHKCQEAAALGVDQAEKSYELPDGRRITLGDERFMAAEALFQPHLIGKDFPGLHDALYESLMNCDIDTRKDLFVNMVCAGGNTCFPGFQERMTKEMSALIQRKNRVLCAPERKESVWIGGSIIASLSTFRPRCISRKEYEENGAHIVHRKCVSCQIDAAFS